MGHFVNTEKKFSPITENSKIDIRHINDVNYIHHYTSVDGLYSILEHQSLRFSNIKYMNDSSEVTIGLQLFLEKIQKLTSKSSLKDFSNIKFELFEKFYKIFSEHIFVCSFSLAEDDLMMWNYYTKTKDGYGFNIKFDPYVFFENIVRKNQELIKYATLYYGMVNYFDEEEYIDFASDPKFLKLLICFLLFFYRDKKSKEIRENILDLFKLYRKAKNDRSNKNNISSFLFNNDTHKTELIDTMGIVRFIKNNSYRNEKEFRIVISLDNDEAVQKLKEAGIYKYRNQNGIFIPYLDIKFDIKDVLGIKISPTKPNNLVKESLEGFCSFCGIKNPKEIISDSTIPSRYI